MSKKSRKKSSKTPSGSPTAKKTPVKARAATQTKLAKTQRTPASKSTGTIARTASHKAASKRLNSSKSASAPKTAAKAGLAEGQKAPAFRLPRDGGGVVALSDYTGQKLVLFFYPRADTPGCTREAIDFTRLSQDFASSGTAVLGVSADSVKAQDGFRDKHQLAVPLLSDSTHEMLEAYGAWGEKTLYGRKFLGIIRSTVLIGGDGRIARIWRNVKVDGHADAVLDAARAL